MPVSNVLSQTQDAQRMRQAADTEVYRSDGKGGITTAPRSFFGKIVQFFSRTERNLTKAFNETFRENFTDRLKNSYGDAIAEKAFRLARPKGKEFDNATPMTRGQMTTAEAYAARLKADDDQQTILKSTERYTPGGGSFQKVAELAGVPLGVASTFTAEHGEHYRLLLKEQVSLKPGWEKLPADERRAVAVETLKYVAGMSAEQIRDSLRLRELTTQKGRELLVQLSDPDAKPEEFVDNLLLLCRGATKNPADIMLEESPASIDDTIATMDVAMERVMKGLPPHKARQLFEAVIKEGGAGRMLLFCAAGNANVLGDSKTSPFIPSGQEPPKPMALARSAVLLQMTAKTLLAKLGERGNVEDARERIDAVEGAGEKATERALKAKKTAFWKTGQRKIKEQEAVDAGLLGFWKLGGGSRVDGVLKNFFKATQQLQAARVADAAKALEIDKKKEPVVDERDAIRAHIVVDARNHMNSPEFLEGLKTRGADNEAYLEIRGIVIADLYRQLTQPLEGGKITGRLSGEDVAARVQAAMDNQAEVIEQVIAQGREAGKAVYAVMDSVEARRDDHVAANLNVFAAIELDRAKVRQERDDDKTVLRSLFVEGQMLWASLDAKMGRAERGNRALLSEIETLQDQVEELRNLVDDSTPPKHVSEEEAEAAGGTPSTERITVPPEQDHVVADQDAAAGAPHAAMGAAPVVLAETDSTTIATEGLKKWVGGLTRQEAREHLSKVDAFYAGRVAEGKTSADFHVLEPVLYEALSAASNISRGVGVFNNLDLLQQELSALQGEAEERVTPEESGLEEGQQVSRLFFDYADLSNFTIQGLDGAKHNVSSSREIAASLHRAIGNANLAEKVSQFANPAIFQPLTQRLTDRSMAVALPDGTRGDPVAEDPRATERQFAYAIQAREDGSVDLHGRLHLRVRALDLPGNEQRKLDPALSFVAVSFTVNIPQEGAVTFTDPPPAYEFKFAERVDEPGPA